MNLTDIEYVRALQSNLRIFDSPQGKEVMKFLEVSTGYNGSIFNPTNRDIILINDGKRQVIGTIKSLMTLEPEQVVALAKAQEE